MNTLFPPVDLTKGVFYFDVVTNPSSAGGGYEVLFYMAGQLMGGGIHKESQQITDPVLADLDAYHRAVQSGNDYVRVMTTPDGKSEGSRSEPEAAARRDRARIRVLDASRSR